MPDPIPAPKTDKYPILSPEDARKLTADGKTRGIGRRGFRLTSGIHITIDTFNNKQPPVAIAQDPAKLTKEDRAEIQSITL